MTVDLYGFSGSGGGGGSAAHDVTPYYGTVTNVPPDAETTVAQHIAPPGGSFRLAGVIVTGNAEAEWLVYDDATVIFRNRTSSTDRGKDILEGRGPLVIPAGHVCTVKALHHEPDLSVRIFYATILGWDA